MIILITGASHTGKTAFAQKLLEKYKYPYLSIDHLKMGLIRSGNTQLSPVFYAENLDVVLGRFKENGKPAVGLKYRPDGSFDASCANVPIPTAVLREIFARAGIFLYADRPTAVYTNASFACIYSIECGDITLYRPQQESFVERFSGERITVGPNGTTVHFEPKTTKMYVRESN